MKTFVLLLAYALVTRIRVARTASAVVPVQCKTARYIHTLESYENRRLMSVVGTKAHADMVYGYEGHNQWVITATNGANAIEVAQETPDYSAGQYVSTAKVTVGKSVFYNQLGATDEIVVYAGNGADKIVVNQTLATVRVLTGTNATDLSINTTGGFWLTSNSAKLTAVDTTDASSVPYVGYHNFYFMRGKATLTALNWNTTVNASGDKTYVDVTAGDGIDSANITQGAHSTVNFGDGYVSLLEVDAWLSAVTGNGQTNATAWQGTFNLTASGDDIVSLGDGVNATVTTGGGDDVFYIYAYSTSSFKRHTLFLDGGDGTNIIYTAPGYNFFPAAYGQLDNIDQVIFRPQQTYDGGKG